MKRSTSVVQAHDVKNKSQQLAQLAENAKLFEVHFEKSKAIRKAIKQ